MKYRKKPVVIEATQWFKNGDHPEDDCKMIYPNRFAALYPHPGNSLPMWQAIVSFVILAGITIFIIYGQTTFF